jgi:hypothetical protein
MDDDAEEDKKQLKFACLELAIRQTKKDQDGMVVDLTADEAVAMADAFYKFITKAELN